MKIIFIVLSLLSFSALAESKIEATQAENNVQENKTQTDWDAAKLSSKKALQDIWDVSKESSQHFVEDGATKSSEFWQSSKQKSSELWEQGKEASLDIWQEVELESKQTWSEGKEKIQQLLESEQDLNTNIDEI